MSCDEQYRDILKHENLKSTKHRNAILEVLEKKDQPLPAEDLYLILKEKGISISLSTVYRVLEALVLKGIAARINPGDGSRAVYELSHAEHRHHLMCMSCRKRIPVGNCPLEDYEKLLEERFGFSVKGHNLEVFGYCEDCRKRGETKN